MILEKGDVAALRLAEQRGWFPTDGEVTAAGLKPADYAERLRRLCSLGIIRGFKTTLVVPPLLGGDWVWAAVLANAKSGLGLANALVARLPFVSEIVLNASLPDRVGPNLAVLFYSRDFDKEADFIRNAPGIEYHEVYRVADYSFPVALPLSRDEKELVRYLVEHPESEIAGVGAAMQRPQTWVRAKLDRLGSLIAEAGLSVVFSGKTYRERYVQVEADVWGIGRLLDTVAFLDQIAGVRVFAALWNREVLINTKWVPGLV
jgi:hypothetical protein